MDLREDQRMKTLAEIADYVDARTGSRTAAQAMSRFEPHVSWDEGFLLLRRSAYANAGHPLVVEAVRDLERYRAAESFAFDSGLAPEGAAAAPGAGRVPVESDSGASGRSGAPATGPVME